jgi:hypothetical protein
VLGAPLAMNYARKFTMDAAAKLTYLPSHPRSLIFWLSGNIIPDSNTATAFQIGIVRNGQTGTTYGRINVTTDVNARAFNYSTNVYLDDDFVVENDFYELYVRNTTNTSVNPRFNDLNWYIDSR